MMSFTLPEELQMLRDNLRRYVDAEMIPREMETLEDGELKPEWREKFQAGMKKLDALLVAAIVILFCIVFAWGK